MRSPEKGFHADSSHFHLSRKTTPLYFSHRATQGTVESMELWLWVQAARQMKQRIAAKKYPSAYNSSFTWLLSMSAYVTQSVVVGMFVSVVVSVIKFFRVY